MNEREALYRTICEHPEDDTPRLVFADWLQEHGDEARAEFIRVQCRLANITADDPDYVSLRIREHLLFDAHHDDWLLDDTPEEGLEVEWIGPYHVTVPCWFVRGFPEWPFPEPSEGDTEDFWAVLKQVLSKTPSRCFELDPFDHEPEDDLSWLANPNLAPFHGLIVCNRFSDLADEEAEVLACSGRFAALDQLHHKTPGLSDIGLRHYVTGKGLPRLTELGLSLSDRVSVAGWRRFARSATAKKLHALELDGVGLTDAILAELGSAKWPKLHRLRFGYSNANAFGRAGLRALASSDGLSQLRSFHISARTLDRIGISTLGDTDKLTLRELTIYGNSGIYSSNATALAKQKGFASLRTLNLDADWIDDRAVSALARSRHLAGLQWLALPKAGFGGDGLRALLTSERWTDLALLSVPRDPRAKKVTAAEVSTALKEMNLPSIRDLTLIDWPVLVRGARALASNPSVSKLQFLDLRKCRLGDSGTAALLDSPYLQQIEFLDLGENNIREGIARLADPAVMPNLRKCHLHNNPLTPATKKRLAERPGVFEPHGATH